MKAEVTHFYATAADLRQILFLAERDGPLQYIRQGYYREADYEVLKSGLLIPGLGFTSDPIAVANASYIVMQPGEKVVLRKVVQLNGIVYSVEQGAHPRCAGFMPGGWYKDNILLYGTISSTSDSKESRTIYHRFRKGVTELGSRVRYAYVGEEAMKMLLQGAHLTGSANAPEKFDLRMPRLRR
jgi:hypothetical protein